MTFWRSVIGLITWRFGWRRLVLRAYREEDPATRIERMREAIIRYPGVPRIKVFLAGVLVEERGADREAETLLREAMRDAPDDGAPCGALAVLQHWHGRDDDEAERLFRREIELSPKDASAYGNYAAFVMLRRKDPAQAERLFERCLALERWNPNHIANYASFLIAQGRFEPAEEQVQNALQLDHRVFRRMRFRGSLELYRGLLARIRGADDTPAVAALKGLLQHRLLSAPWTYEHVLDAARPHLDARDREKYEALAAVLLDERPVASLDAFPWWTRIATG
jgi:tetratricopeptide (TPR) repeat protein